jgi:hypothetical protein
MSTAAFASACVIEVLSRLVSTRGAPTFLRIRSYNGPEFVSTALWIGLCWLGYTSADCNFPK